MYIVKLTAIGFPIPTEPRPGVVLYIIDEEGEVGRDVEGLDWAEVDAKDTGIGELSAEVDCP